jgi:signal transduction histidine kinase
LIFGVLTLVLASSLIISYYEVRRAAENSASERLSSLSRAVAQVLQQSMTTRLTAMRRLAADSTIIGALRSTDRPPSAAALAVLSTLRTRSDSLTPPELLKPDGTPIGNIHLETSSDIDQVRAQLVPTESPDSGQVGKLYKSEGHTAFWMAVPVRENGILLGYVAQERRFNTNPRTLQPFRDLIGSDIEMYFRNPAGDVWVDLTGTTVPAPAAVRPAFDSLQILTYPTKGPALAASAVVRGTPLLVTVEYPVARLLARPQATIRTLAVIAILLIVFGAAIAWFISRQLTRPLVELTAAAEAIAEGQYSQRVAERGTDEIGRLGAAFNRMARQVQESSNASDDAVISLTHSAATQEFLAEASRILAESLSDESLLAELARYCVPTLADYCTIQVIDIDGSIRRVETAHHDPTKEASVRALVKRYEYRIDGPGEVPEVIRSQKPLILPRLDLASISVPDAETAALLADVGPTAFLCVPLIARGQSLGAMSFTMTTSGRSFSQDDLGLAMELARRTAVAIDNAIIYRTSLALRLEAEAASRAKSDFLAKMSHEIRTPINAMMGYAELLELGISGPVSEAQAKQLSRIRASGDHLTSLVNEILDLAKIEAGQMGVEPTAAVTADALDAALGLIRPQAASKGVSIVNRNSGDVSEYLGDPQRVQQILTNLLSNAVKFTAPGGTVTVSIGGATRDDLATQNGVTEWTCIVVADTGIGIASDDMERIFQPFVQVENGYTRNHGGTGLGLTISRSLAQMMDGELEVESTLGQGSRFTLWLPSPNSCIVDA